MAAPPFFLHLHGGLGQVGQGVAALELGVLNDASVGIAGEVAGPLDKGAVLVLARGDGEAANGADDAGVRELGLGRDDAVRDVVVERLLPRGSGVLVVSQRRERVRRRERIGEGEEGRQAGRVTHAVLLLLDLELGAVLEGPLDDVGLLLGLGGLAALQGGPEIGEVLDCTGVIRMVSSGAPMGPCQSSIWKGTRGGGFLDARLMWCQTWLRGALMTALSVTEVAVGIDMVTGGWVDYGIFWYWGVCFTLWMGERVSRDFTTFE